MRKYLFLLFLMFLVLILIYLYRILSFYPTEIKKQKLNVSFIDVKCDEKFFVARLLSLDKKVKPGFYDVEVYENNAKLQSMKIELLDANSPNFDPSALNFIKDDFISLTILFTEPIQTKYNKVKISNSESYLEVRCLLWE